MSRVVLACTMLFFLVTWSKAKTKSRPLLLVFQPTRVAGHAWNAVVNISRWYYSSQDPESELMRIEGLRSLS